MRRTFLSLCVAGFLSVWASAPAEAATLRIEFTDFDVAFDGYELSDSNTVDTGSFFKADALKTMDFFLDNQRIGSLSSGIFADLTIGVNDPILATGDTVDGFGGYFTLFTNSNFNEGVALALYNIDLIFNPIGAPMLTPRLALAGVASAQVLAQVLLPFNVEFDPSVPVDVLFIVNLANVETNEGYVRSFTGTGVGQVQGDANVVPEPTSLILLGSGLLGAVGMRRRATRNAQAA